VISVELNGAWHELPDGATVADAVAHLGVALDARGVAVALDREVVPRGAWASTPLTARARVEILTAIQGG
jgi:sulfur carrier protein